MEVLIFIVVIVILIVVHEFGHFVAAKLAGMRVDEFGLGYPPRTATFATMGETTYTLNWLPFGGFVKIFGEDGGAKDSRAFSSKPRVVQVLVLLAGVAMNIVLAYVLITAALVAGTPQALATAQIAGAKDVTLAVSYVLPGSPADAAGLLAGDEITSATDAVGQWSGASTQTFTDFVATSDGGALALKLVRNGEQMTLSATPAEHVVPDDPSRYELGVEIADVGVVPVSLSHAIVEGASFTWGATILTALGLWHFFAGVFTLHANLSKVAGPVGIAGAVGSASAQGFGDLLSLMAVISINLALINLIPIPALDGGRILFVIIEGVIRRPIKPRVAQALNGAGFAFLILLMPVITLHDIYKIVT